MTTEDRRLLIENTAEMRELKGELKEFKEHVMGRVERLEKKEGERNRDLKSTLSLIISTGVLAVSIIVNFFNAKK
jgi:rhamnose utilization protein RhaD (predicted bifunctional aldolase and dehydrogenase)